LFPVHRFSDATPSNKALSRAGVFVPTVMAVTLAAGRSESTPHLLGEAMRHSESARVSARIQRPLIRKSRQSTLLRSADSVTQTTQWRDFAPPPHWQKRREM
jgi:hypothetical protein